MDFDLNVEAAHDGGHESQANRSESVSMCTICRELLSNHRTCVTLQCGHHFHLDCIGSTFNGMKEMRCPNCRNLEQGRWSIPRDSPDSDTGIDVSIVFTGFGIYSSDLIFGCDLCPFEGSDSMYNFHVEELIHLDQCDNFHKPAPEGRHYCPFVEYIFTILGPENDFSSQQIAGGWDPLSPLTPLATNPRLFRSDSQPQLIIARRYFAHPVIDPPTLGESISVILANNQVVPSDLRDNLLGNVSILADDQVVPSYLWNNLVANGSVHPLHLGGSVVPNAPMANDSVAQPYQDTNFVANVPMVQSYSSDNLVSIASVHQFHPGGNLVPNALMDNDSVVRPYQYINLVANGSVHPLHLGGSVVHNALMANDSVVQPYQDTNFVANAPMAQSYSSDNLVSIASVHQFHPGGNLVPNALMDNDSVVRPYQDINLVANASLVQSYPWDNLAANGSVHRFQLGDDALMDNDSIVQPYQDVNLVTTVQLVQRYPWDNIAANGSVHSHHLRDSSTPYSPMAYDSVVQPYHVNLVTNVPLVSPSPDDNVMDYVDDVLSTIGTNAPMVPPSPSTNSMANAVALPYHCHNSI